MSLLIESGFIYFAIWVPTNQHNIYWCPDMLPKVVAMLNFYLDWRAPVLQAVLRGGYDMVMVRVSVLV
jgi:hypothetical protein